MFVRVFIWALDERTRTGLEVIGHADLHLSEWGIVRLATRPMPPDRKLPDGLGRDAEPGGGLGVGQPLGHGIWTGVERANIRTAYRRSSSRVNGLSVVPQHDPPQPMAAVPALDVAMEFDAGGLPAAVRVPQPAQDVDQPHVLP